MDYRQRSKRLSFSRVGGVFQKQTVSAPIKSPPSWWDLFFKNFGRIELVFGLLAIPLVLWVGWNEIQSLAEQRRVNAWQLLAIKAEGANSGKRTALEFLNKRDYCFKFTDFCLLEKEPLVGVNLQGDYLVGVSLVGANLRGADLTGANLFVAILTGANLLIADLTGANLAGANLTGANLIMANLSNAELREADLRGASLGGANLTGANLIKAKLTKNQLLEACVTDRDKAPTLSNREEFEEVTLKLCGPAARAQGLPLWDLAIFR